MMKIRLINTIMIAGLLLLLLALGQQAERTMYLHEDNNGKIESAECVETDNRLLSAVQDSECGQREESSDGKSPDGKSPDNESSDDKSSDSEPSMEDMSSVVASILAQGTQSLFCDYPVDEAFVCWIGGQYGEELLVQLAQKLTEGEKDSQLWYELTGSTMHVLWTEYCKDHGFASYELEKVVWKEASGDSDITIDFVGDINFDARWHTMKAAEEAGGVAECIAPEIQKELQSADITVVNNEFTYTTSDGALEGKAYTFRAAPDTVELLELFGTDIVSLANNHTYDYGKKGLLDTIKTLEQAQIAYVGAGRNLAEASAVSYFIVDGRKIAFVSASEIERFYNYTKMATQTEAGVLKTQQEEAVLRAISKARANSDYVIAYIHWGTEGVVTYDERQRALAQAYVDAGADAVIGGHSHRMQGVTFLDNVPVVYGMGNFWFSTGTLYTTIAQLRIDEKGQLSLAMIPCIQKNLKTQMLSGQEEVKAFYHYLADVSTNVGIDADGVIHAYKDVNAPGESPYTYTSGRRYGLHQNDVDLEGRLIDIVGNLIVP